MNALPTVLALLALSGAVVGTLPLDVDGDGLSTRAELAGGTNPVLRDTDGDGLADGREREGDTDPTDSDTDGDGLVDGREYDLGADPTVVDTDDDGLDDAREADAGADPTDPDTDGDGLADVAEIEGTDVLPGADPLHRDVFVEVDYAAGCWGGLAANRTAAAFADAPVENPDGESGIDLHFVRDEELGLVETDSVADLNRVRAEAFDRRQQGYRYVAVGAKRAYRKNDGQWVEGWANERSAAVACTPGETLMHELGHLLGLYPSYPGVDSEAVPFEDYPSVMNYNAGDGVYRYSTGTASEDDVDDWSIVANSLGDVGVGRLRPLSENGSMSYGDLPPAVEATSRPPKPGGGGAVPGRPVVLVAGYGLTAVGVLGVVRTGRTGGTPDETA